MKTGFSDAEKTQIYRAKAILKKLWKTSGVSQKEVLQRLEQQNLPTNQSNLSTWLSTKEGNYSRPPENYLEALLEIFCPPTQLDETRDELFTLLQYQQGPLTPETLHNKVFSQITHNMKEILFQNQARLRADMSHLDLLLEEIEPLIFEYDKGYPVIYVEPGNRKLLWQLLGKDRALHQKYAVEEGHEVPFSQIQCQETVIQIINNLNEGIRLVQAYVIRSITEEEQGMLLFDFYLVEDFVSYAWEIADVLLHNNTLCKAVPVLKRTLLNVMTVAWGIRYILENQNRQSSAVQFQNLLELKGKPNSADVLCSVAVYTGMLARQCLRSNALDRAKKGLELYTQAAQTLTEHHPGLPSQQDVFYYKKELANLHYDIANYLLRRKDTEALKDQHFETSMALAHKYYAEIMDTPNVFVDGLCTERSVHIQIFYVLSAAWSLQKPASVIKLINMLDPGSVLNDVYWKTQIARAIAYGTLALKTKPKKDKVLYQESAEKALDRARLVDGFGEQTRQEIENEYVLATLFGAS